jgi:hypothetical protein
MRLVIVAGACSKDLIKIGLSSGKRSSGSPEAGSAICAIPDDAKAKASPSCFPMRRMEKGAGDGMNSWRWEWLNGE